MSLEEERGGSESDTDTCDSRSRAWSEVSPRAKGGGSGQRLEKARDRFTIRATEGPQPS